jgi:N6-adenosine-specific RNA methylase IME4
MKVDIYNTDKKYQIIYADPPWSYRDKGCEGAAAAQYDTMSVADIAALPVKKIADKTAVLFLWATYPKMEEALQLIKAWGFTYKSIAFQWVKLNKRINLDTFQITTVGSLLKKACFFGLGRWTRGNTECCLIATKGKPRRVSASVGQLVFAPLGRHSEKPAEVREKIIQLVGDLPRIELFARQAAEGWDCWGDEAPESELEVNK